MTSRNGTPPPGTDSSQASWSGRFVQKAFVGAVSLLAVFYGFCTLALILYAFVFPWTTGVQVQRWLTADGSYEKRYEPRPLSAFDQDLPLAVVAAEDARFFEHNGIDWKEIGKAIEENRDGDAKRRGGSSITQQLVKNLFLTTHSTYLRKALELPLTYLAELILTKRRILELYVNVIEWGPGVYGAEAAAQYHYQTSAAQLTRYQAAALAACIPNPRVRRPANMNWYAQIILKRMDQLGTIRDDLRSDLNRGSHPRRRALAHRHASFIPGPRLAQAVEAFAVPTPLPHVSSTSRIRPHAH